MGYFLYAEYIMQTAGLYSGITVSKAEIKIAWRNMNNLRYADDTTLMSESEEELESLDDGECILHTEWMFPFHSSPT